MQAASVPTTIGIAIFLTARQKRRDIEREKIENARDALRHYLGGMTGLLVDKQLQSAAHDDAVARAATALTIAALSRIDDEGGKTVACFLSNAELLGTEGGPKLLAGVDL